ncbi:B-cell receptor-associated protein [Trachipleistophora hominis]|uniref:B-cell receptor-associated protein n=1 Tax=Trachipleistophora hominis TaxID=72359 RepID=L7JRY1_TRAHO|nr:B-cell receptor-associated protein [Trachipleistophora hominis]
MSLTLLITQSFLLSELLFLTVLLLPFSPQKLTIALPRPVHHLIYALVMLIAFSFADSLYRRSYQQYFYLNGITLFLFLILKRMLNVVGRLKREEMEVSVMRRQIENHKKFVMEMVEENKKLKEENDGLRNRVVLGKDVGVREDSGRGGDDGVVRNRVTGQSDTFGSINSTAGTSNERATSSNTTDTRKDAPPGNMVDKKNNSLAGTHKTVDDGKAAPLRNEENEDENWEAEW